MQDAGIRNPKFQVVDSAKAAIAARSQDRLFRHRQAGYGIGQHGRKALSNALDVWKHAAALLSPSRNQTTSRPSQNTREEYVAGDGYSSRSSTVWQ